MIPWSAEKRISPYQFAVFRIAFGVYLTVHFAHLIPYGGELFGRNGVIGDPALNPLSGIFPNPLVWFGSDGFVTAWLILAVVLSLLLGCGIRRRTVAVILWFIWASLYNRNNLISNPGIPYVGLVLLLCAFISSGDRLALGSRGCQPATPPWRFPAMVYWTAWWLLAIGYTFSGLAKLGSPSWVNGEAIRLLLDNPLARPGIVRDIHLGLPESALRCLTWGALAMEILFLPLSLHRHTRFFAWASLLAMHLGIVLVVDFADLTFGMIMVHWFVLDPDWFPASKREGEGRNIVFFDGVCVMCNGVVRFLSGEDHDRRLWYAPLQGETYGRISNAPTEAGVLKTMVFAEGVDSDNTAQRISTRSTAAIRILWQLGGFWKLVGGLLWLIPKPFRRIGYDLVATHRYRWFGKKNDGAACELPTPQQRERLLP